MDYQEFVASKMIFDNKQGFGPVIPVHSLLKPHQSDIVQWACEGGRRAIFAAFGLGKSLIQLEVMRQVQAVEGGKQLIICPLGVRQEFKRDAGKIGMEALFVRWSEEVKEDGLYLTNYESVRDGRLDVNLFNAVSLDEASVLRSYGSKTYQNFLTLFSSIKYRFVATATPSPNRHKELIHYAGFLGIMDTGQALTRFFQRDSTKANNLTLYPHKEREFYLWLNSWAIFLQKPSDLGYSDDGYELPPAKITYHRIKTDLTFRANRDGQMRMFNDASMGVQDASAEKRRSIEARVAKCVEIITKDQDNHYILWHDQEEERRAIKKAIPSAVEVYGSLDLDEREQRIIDFTDGKFKYLATKPILSGSGCNFQYHCHKAIYVGIGFKFNDFIQSIHRILRFLQDKPVEIHIIHTDTEDSVLRILKEKWQQHENTVAIMTEIIRKYGLNVLDMAKELGRSIGCERVEVNGTMYRAVNNDCVDETGRMETDSVHLIHTSIPFSNHYEYSPSYNDFGHNKDNDSFFAQMDFLTPELLRVLKPGRVAAIHVKDRVLFGNVTGYGMPSMDPFHVDCIQHYRKHGFIYFGMITVVTDVVRENNQTYRLGWTEQCKDGSKMGVGCPEYILLFRKLPTDTSRAYADDPVKKTKEAYSRARWQTDAHAFWRSSGDRNLTTDEITKYPVDVIGKMFEQWTLENLYDYEAHVRIGEHLDAKGVLPSTFMLLDPASHNQDVWHDVNRMLTLNSNQRQRNMTNHICPLQHDIVTRIIERYSNPGDTVYDPFGGLMTVPYNALKLGRFGVGCELNPEYFKDGLTYMNAADREIKIPSLFDFERQLVKEAA
jgi:DNA modification methylase